MKYDPQKQPFDAAHIVPTSLREGKYRRSIRLQGYDYARAGAYYVTIVAQNRENLFGEIVDASMRLNEFGQIAAETWEWLALQYPYVELGTWVVMPNHLHGIIILHEHGRGGSRSAPTNGPIPPDVLKRKPLGSLIGAFKTVSTKKINILRNTEGGIVWQRNYASRVLGGATNISSATMIITTASIYIWNTTRITGQPIPRTPPNSLN
jgi:hypothetical protein